MYLVGFSTLEGPAADAEIRAVVDVQVDRIHNDAEDVSKINHKTFLPSLFLHCDQVYFLKPLRYLESNSKIPLIMSLSYNVFLVKIQHVLQKAFI